MRIIHYLQQLRLEDGGVVRAVIDICNLLASRGHQITFLSCDATDAPQPWKDGAPGSPRIVTVEPVRGPFGLLTRSAMHTVQHELAQADALHLHGMWHRSNYQIALAATRRNIPYVYSSHGMLDDWAMGMKTLKKRITLSLIARRVIEQARCIHCAASGELEESAKWFPRGRGQVVPLVFDLEPFRTLPGPDLARQTFDHLRQPGPHLLFLSRLVANKGADVLIQAAAQLRRDGHAFSLTIAGTGDPDHERELRALVQRNNLTDRTAFVGHIAGPLKLSLFEACDLFILPTIHENFGFATIEALAAGRPAITSPGTKIWRELEDGGGALIADRTPAATAAAIATLLTDPARRTRMGQAGRRWVFDYLQPDRLGAHYEAIYRLDPLTAPAPEKHAPITADTHNSPRRTAASGPP